MNPINKDTKPKFEFKEVDEVPFIAKGGLYDEYFEALEAKQRKEIGDDRKWIIWKEDSPGRISLPMNWREKFDMKTRTSYDKTGEIPQYTAYVRLKDIYPKKKGGDRNA